MLMTNWLNRWRQARECRRLRRPRRGAASRPFLSWQAECLEARTLLSNISVTAQSGVVQFNGDSGSHTVSATIVSGNLHLVGSSGTTFTFNGTTNSTIDIPLSSIGTVKEIDVNMQGGDDSITFDATGLAAISGNVNFNLGDGANTLVFTNATVTGRLTVTGGANADSTTLTNDTLGSLSISTGDGNDTTALTGVTLTTTRGHGRRSGPGLAIDTGNGNDTTTLTTVTGANSRRPAARWDIALGSGTDTTTLTSVTTHSRLRVTSGDGNNVVTTNTSTFGAPVKVELGDGQNQINVNTSTFERRAVVNAGNGSPSAINVNSSTFERRAVVNAGDGNSSAINVEGSTFNHYVRFVAGGSNAQLNVEAAGSGGAPTAFHGIVVVRMTGPSAVVNFGSATSTDKVVFDRNVFVFGGEPEATVNVATVDTTFNKMLRLFRATRHDV
jgi:hypothetical protein